MHALKESTCLKRTLEVLLKANKYLVAYLVYLVVVSLTPRMTHKVIILPDTLFRKYILFIRCFTIPEAASFPWSLLFERETLGTRLYQAFSSLRSRDPPTLTSKKSWINGDCKSDCKYL